MSHRRLLPFLLLVLLLAGCLHTAPAPPPSRTPVILISIDGFRADYLKRGLTPVMSRLAAEGAWAVDGMRPSYPSLTYPNHYVLVTGKRPDRNGVVNNIMEDPAIPGVLFTMSNRPAVQDGRWWDQAEPIWITAERAGVHTAPTYWPGSEAEIRGLRPRRWTPFDQSRPSNARVDDLLAQFDASAPQRPGFATLYFDAVDTQGHHTGPDSPELNRVLGEVDAAIGRLVEGLKARGLYDRVNLVLVADHGMAPMDTALRVIADDWVSPEIARLVNAGEAVGFEPRPGHEAEAEARLLAPHRGGQCWRKAEVPARFHYGRNPRVPAIVCLADLGGYVISREAEARRTGALDRGAHGYDPEAIEMRALFVAHGPGVKAGVRIAPFDNVSVYPFLAHLLELTAEPGDGKLSDLKAALER
jgi:predicted AlkP superfamily pyrophosphatase or phosphodiesterase